MKSFLNQYMHFSIVIEALRGRVRSHLYKRLYSSHFLLTKNVMIPRILYSGDKYEVFTIY